VSYRGTVQVERACLQECSFEFRGKLQQKQLEIESLSPEGWIKRSFVFYKSKLYLKPVPLTRIYVDNRGNSEVTLACGQWHCDVPAGSHQCIKIPTAPRDSCRTLTINSNEVGILTAENVLVDTLGTRSYRFQTVVYCTNPYPFARALRPPDGLETCFHDNYIHKLPSEIDYFLEPAPHTIRLRGTSRMPQIVSLTVSTADVPTTVQIRPTYETPSERFTRAALCEAGQ
jgi:hypothetical protein